MTGVVDEFGRALVRITLKNPTTGVSVHQDAWVDTGFNGELVTPAQVILSLGLQQSSRVQAGLGDGSQTVLETFTCAVDWFGESKLVEVIANAGRHTLLGVGLLLNRTLTVDYANRTVTIA